MSHTPISLNFHLTSAFSTNHQYARQLRDSPYRAAPPNILITRGQISHPPRISLHSVPRSLGCFDCKQAYFSDDSALSAVIVYYTRPGAVVTAGSMTAGSVWPVWPVCRPLQIRFSELSHQHRFAVGQHNAGDGGFWCPQSSRGIR